MQPLTGSLDDDPSLIVIIADACFWLEIGMFLPGGRELILKYDIGISKAPFCIPFADRDMQQQIRSQVFMHEWSIFLKCYPWVCDGGKVLVLNLDQFCSRYCRLFAFSHYESY